MDWHFAVTGLGTATQANFGRENTCLVKVRMSSLLLRPLRLAPVDANEWRSWDVFSDILEEFVSPDGQWFNRRNKVKGLREALRAGPNAVRLFLRNPPDSPTLPQPLGLARAPATQLRQGGRAIRVFISMLSRRSISMYRWRRCNPVKSYQLRLTLLSDATFGRGDGVAGLVDAEVQHDEVGLPYLGGRTSKVYWAPNAPTSCLHWKRPGLISDRWRTVGDRLFGRSGANLKGEAILRVGPARLPDDLRLALMEDVQKGRLTPNDVLEMATALRRQTAMDEWGVPQENTLRTMRVVLRNTAFWAALDFLDEPKPEDLALLAACVKALRRAGTGRNRGRGRLRAELLDAEGQPVTDLLFREFRKAVMP
ncbi:hypothetical protein [Candidatus Amarolinea dominans]|uniref:hypothetical protein n=1 Tax=Candidatus Amarolinea dominans TaxID=3140696 RepID=UPI0031CCB94C